MNKLSAADLTHESAALYDWWPKLARDNKRKVVKALIETIVIGHGEIAPTFSHFSASEELCKNQSKPGFGEGGQNSDFQ